MLAPTSATPRDRDDEPPPIGAIELCRPGGCAQLTLAPLRPQQAGLAGHVQGVHVAGDGARVAITRGSPRAGRTVAELYELPSGRRIAVLSSRARALSPVSAGGQCTRPARWLGPGLLVQESDCEWPGDYFLHDTDGRRLSTLPFAGDDATPATWHDLGDGVRIPGADEYRAPEKFREDILEAMKQRAPQGFDDQVRRYYEELIK